MSPLEKVEDFFARGSAIRYKKGETILHAGDEPQGVFWLKKGYVRLYCLSSEGEEMTLIIFKPQDFFPMIWAVNNAPNLYYVEAMTPVEVYRLPREEFLSFVKEHPDVLFELMSKVLVRLGGLLQRMQYLAFGKAYEKVASILFICAERFGKETIGKVTINVPLTHKDVANLLGMTRETVSIEMKKLAKAGIIDYKGKFVVVRDLAKLRQESSLDND